MKILYFSHQAGVASFIQNQIEQVAEEHDVVWLCHSNKTPRDRKPYRVVELPLYQFNFASRIRAKLERNGFYLPPFSLTFRNEIQRLILRERPDIIHCQFAYESLNLLENLGSQRTPIVIHLRGYDASEKLNSGWYVKKLKKLLQKPNIYTVSVCKALLDNLERKGIKPWNARVIHSNTDTDFFSRTNYHFEPPFNFVQNSSFRSKKGHEYTLKAFAHFLERSDLKTHKLYLTGKKNELFPIIEQQVKRLNLEENVVFTGHLNKYELKELLNQCQIYLQHSVTPEDGDQEGIPNAIMEAMAMEMPIVSTYHSGIPELVDHGINGLLVNERDVEKYVLSIEKITSFNFLKENREKVSKSFSKAGFLKKIDTLYSEKLSTSKK